MFAGAWFDSATIGSGPMLSTHANGFDEALRNVVRFCDERPTSDVYRYEMNADKFASTKRLTLLK